MDENRKNLIVKEIIHWKRSKLLPEHYCDFLLSLYTEGNSESVTKRERNASFLTNILVVFIISLLPISLLVIYFTEMSFVLQMVLLAFFILFCLSSIPFLKGKYIHVQIPLVISAIIFFLMQIHACSYINQSSDLSLIIVIVGNCLAWIIVGKKAKLNYFYISGFVGIIVFTLLLFR